MLSRLKFEIDDLVNEILDNIPERIWVSKTTTFFDPCMGGGQFIKAVIEKLHKYDHTYKNIEKRVFGCEKHKRDVQYAINKNKLIGEFWPGNPLEEEYDMKFDCVLGNLPFQNSKSKSDAGKLYLDLTRKCFEIVKDDGVVALLTPSTLAQEKKTGLTLKGMSGLKLVNYEADKFFNVGVDVISWIVDKKYSGQISIIDNDGTIVKRAKDDVLVQEKDKIAFTLFEKIKNNKSKMFVLDQSTGGKHKQRNKNKEFKYPIYVNYFSNKIEYSDTKPALYKKKKLVISLGKVYSDEHCIITSKDVGQYHCTLDVSTYNKKEIENIKLFLFSPLTVNICSKYRSLYRVGINAILYSFPPIDVKKKYTQDDVAKHFNLTKKEVDWLLK